MAHLILHSKMQLLMTVQCRMLGEGTTAIGAAVWPLFSLQLSVIVMNTLVFGHVIVQEAFPTDVTTVRTFPTVDPCMLGQLIVVDKCLLAHLIHRKY
jgi:hypothetical protein